MKKMLMLGTNNGSIELIEYARSQGIYTVVTDYLEPKVSEAKLKADEYWMISTDDLDMLEKKCRECGINAVICGVSEFNQDMVLRLSNRLNLPCYCSEDAWHYSRNKADFKALCRKTGVPVPKDYHLTDELTEKQLESVIYPVIVKPVDLCSNRGISYCYNQQELIQAYRYARSLSKDKNIIVERMLDGRDWVAYYALADGEISLLGLYVAYTENGYPRMCYTLNTTVSDKIEEYVKQLDSKIVQTLKLAGCKDGVCWVQLILDKDGRFYAIEMGYRLPGDLFFLPLKNVCHFDSVKWMVDYACGIKHNAIELPKPQRKAFVRCACSYMLWTSRRGKISDISGLDQIKQSSGMKIHLSAKVGDLVEAYRPVVSILFDTDDCNSMCEIVNEINKNVRIKDLHGENMVIYFSDLNLIKSFYIEENEGKVHEDEGGE